MKTRYPLLRCLAIYRQIPGKFMAAFGLLLLLNLGLTGYQYLLGRAIHDVERGAAVVRTASGALDYSVALRWAVILIGVAAARGIIQYVAGIVALITGQELLGILRASILRHVLLLDLGYHLQHGVGEMVSRTTRDADKVRDALINFWRNVVETGLVIAASVGFLWWYNPWLAVAPAALVVVGIVVFVRQANALVALDRRVGDAYDAVGQDLVEGVNGIRVIKAFGLEANRIARFNGSVAQFITHATAALKYAASHVPVPQIVVALGQVWVVGAGAVLVSQGKLNLGELVAATLAMNTVIFRFEGIGRIIQIFADARSSAARIMELLDAESKIVSSNGKLPTGALGFQVKDVSVLAANGKEIISNCSLAVEPGEVVAALGATGAGKSTLAALLPRLVDADRGQVLVGNRTHGWHNVKTLDLSDLRQRVQVVSQDCFLFSDSLRANLLQGNPAATDDDIAVALRLAAADEIVAQLPDGLATTLGDRGVTLSGGQRQRIALARALLANPSVLVLDDSTSALDALTEGRILNNIRSAFGKGSGITMLIVTSKPATVAFADRVVVLAHGTVASEGPAHALVHSCPAYRDLLGISHAPS
ncbi:MAG: ABC transporter ATP-binding protein [Deltaproteobacteria bacterium]|nr:ABC transporter ATP-binding protein [Deltaproteobacteria bacterium]